MVLDEPTNNDEVFKVNGFQMVVDTDLMRQVGGIAVDYIDHGFGSGFKLTPKTRIAASGGCGSSCSC